MKIDKKVLIDDLEKSYNNFAYAKNESPQNNLKLAYIKGQYEYIEHLLMNYYDVNMVEIKEIRRSVFEDNTKNSSIQVININNLDEPTYIRNKQKTKR